MKNLAGTLLSLFFSFALVMVPTGMRVDMPEFWITPFLYGLPLLALAWPVYLNVFKRLGRTHWWGLAFIGIVLAPIPFFITLMVHFFQSGGFQVERPLQYFLPWRSVFGIWYGVFGAMLGSWVGLTRLPSITTH